LKPTLVIFPKKAFAALTLFYKDGIYFVINRITLFFYFKWRKALICLIHNKQGKFITLYRWRSHERKKNADENDRYEDFLNDLSHFSSKDEEKYLADGTEKALQDAEIILHVGENVKKIRDKKGLSLKDISQRTGLNVSLLEEIEQGKVSPPLGIIIKLAKALDMKMGYFISGAENQSYTIVRKDDRKLFQDMTLKSDKYGYEFISLAPNKKTGTWNPLL